MDDYAAYTAHTRRTLTDANRRHAREDGSEECGALEAVAALGGLSWLAVLFLGVALAILAAAFGALPWWHRGALLAAMVVFAWRLGHVERSGADIFGFFALTLGLPVVFLFLSGLQDGPLPPDVDPAVEAGLSAALSALHSAAALIIALLPPRAAARQ
jgi:hypothetical protein